MQTVQRSDGTWWVEGVPECEPCGPYETKAEAESDRRGMKRFLRYGDQREFMTSERERPATKIVGDR